MTREKSRIDTLRETNTREEEYIFEEPDALSIPNTVQERFQNEGLDLRWIRISLRGQEDIMNVGKREQEGWTFVEPGEVPEMASTSYVRDEGRYLGTVCRGDVALAKKPINQVKARRAFYEKKANDMMDAVNAQLYNNSDARLRNMPVSNSSRSTTMRGRTPNFQD
jgi:hypothetical protein|tara:strand:- start:2050 stop:2547 length:498 start_codon:yes stop_codon:yes gene_type:complete